MPAKIPNIGGNSIAEFLNYYIFLPLQQFADFHPVPISLRIEALQLGKFHRNGVLQAKPDSTFGIAVVFLNICYSLLKASGQISCSG